MVNEWKKKIDTTKMGPEELRRLGLEDARRPPGQSPGGVLHQQGGVGVRAAGAYPAALAGIALLVGVTTWAYYFKNKPTEDKRADSPTPQPKPE
eukprot:c19506_g1_i1 orf=120-401(+)